MYLESNGTMKLIDIATTLNLKDFQIRKWKSQYKWEDELKWALPKVNKNAETHVFSKYFPEETLELIEAIKESIRYTLGIYI